MRIEFFSCIVSPLFFQLFFMDNEEDDIFGEDYFPVDPDMDELPIDLDEIAMDLEHDPEELVNPEITRDSPPPTIPSPQPLKEQLPPQIVPDAVCPSEYPPDDTDKFFAISASSDPSRRLYMKLRARTETTPSDIPHFLEKPLAELVVESMELAQQREEEKLKWQSVTEDAPIDTRQFVDKYKPQAFIDLVSDDAINRKFLVWLSEWKKKGNHPSASITISPLTLPIMQTTHANEPILAEPQNRKVLLIGGPPGVGKSALIEVCCRHFKYQIVESNASEDRGKNEMTKRITDVTGTRSVLDGTKPQILVIEEIDGEDCTAPEVLVDILHKRPEMIKRPIICVCSDVYKKSLRGLREMSTVVTVNPPKSLRLAEKIKKILVSENVRMESLAVDKLISVCDCDVRSCLNQLQALVARRHLMHDKQIIRVSDVMKYVANESRSADAAVKDNQKSELELMEMIFEPKRSRGETYRDAIATAIANSKSLPSTVSEIFTHCIVTVPFSDVSMRHAKRVGELVALGDVGITGQWQLAMRYASHFCAAIGKPRIDIHNARKLISARIHANSDRVAVTQALSKSSAHSFRGAKLLMNNKHHFGLTLSRLLLVVMNPDHNPVWVKKGQAANYCHPELIRVARVYAELGIELIDESSGRNDSVLVGDHQIYQMNPNLRALCFGEDTIPSYTVGSQMGDLLKTQIVIQLAKTKADGTAELISRGSKRSLVSSPVVVADDEQMKKARTALNLGAWAGVKKVDKAHVGTTGKVRQFDFEFRFNEGHTNAVKRVLRMSDFFVKKNIDVYN